MNNQQIKTNILIPGAIALGGVVLFSSKSVFAKMAYAYKADPLTVLYFRMLFALPLALIIGYYFEKRREWQGINTRDVVLTALISVLGYYVSALFNFFGLLYVEASIERLILFLYPTMVIVLSAVFANKKISFYQVLAISVSYAGLFIAFADKLMIDNSTKFWYGAFLILMSSFTYAIFLTIADGLISRMGSVRFTTIAIVSMSVCIILHVIIVGKAQVSGFDQHVYWYCLIMGVFSTVIPVYMFNAAIEKLGSSNIAIVSCLGPICTLAFSAALLSESVSVYQLIGTVVVIGGILIIYLKKRNHANT